MFQLSNRSKFRIAVCFQTTYHSIPQLYRSLASNLLKGTLRGVLGKVPDLEF